MKGLYAIVDTDACASRGLRPLQVLEAVIRARPPVVQIRAKGVSPRAELELLVAARAITPPSTLLFGNDRPDLAVLAGCDGVHLGQSDLPIDEARRFARGLRVGLSTHDLEQVEIAVGKAPDYVALGPIFRTGSKKDAEPEVGLEQLRSASRLCADAGIPLVAIGGIDLSRLPEVLLLADSVACIGALLPKAASGKPCLSPAEEVFRRTGELSEALRG